MKTTSTAHLVSRLTTRAAILAVAVPAIAGPLPRAAAQPALLSLWPARLTLAEIASRTCPVPPDDASPNDAAPAKTDDVTPVEAAGFTPGAPAPTALPLSAANSDALLAKLSAPSPSKSSSGAPADLFTSRVGATLPIATGFSLEAGRTQYDLNHHPSLGESKVIGDFSSSPSAAADLVDATLHLTLVEFGPITISALGGMRATLLDASWYATAVDESTSIRHERDRFVPLPVAGGSIDWRLANGVSVRGVGLTSTSDTGQFLDLRLESVFAINRSTEFSVGFEHLRNDVGDETSLGASLRRSALMMQLRFGF